MLAWGEEQVGQYQDFVTVNGVTDIWGTDE